MSEKEKCCQPNYEALYSEYFDKYNQMSEKCAAIHSDLLREIEKRKMLEAQMEVVRLIFGGNK